MCDAANVQVICPTCQNVFAGSHAGDLSTVHGVVFDIFGLGRMACPAVARVQRPPAPEWASAGQPSLASRAKAGGVRSQIRTRLRRQFPANREINREFRDFWLLKAKMLAGNALCRSHFSANSLCKLTGKKFEITGNENHGTGNLQGETAKQGFVFRS